MHEVVTIATPGLGDRSYLAHDGETGIVVDAQRDIDRFLTAADEAGVQITHVLETHIHNDYVTGGYELADLGYGQCKMVLATAAGEDRAAEALRRLGVVRIATKYPRIAARYFQDTGRQAEIVEVKGSVELAPLTGLAEGIVDLTATGQTLRENGLVVREEIAQCTARLIANPVAHKLKAAAVDALLDRLDEV